MWPIKCTCGELLGDKQLEYEELIKEYCLKHKIELNDFIISRDPIISDARSKIIKNLVVNDCCKLVVLTNIDLIALI